MRVTVFYISGDVFNKPVGRMVGGGGFFTWKFYFGYDGAFERSIEYVELYFDSTGSQRFFYRRISR